MVSRRMVLVLGALTLLATTANAGPAKGTFTANGKKVNLSYAYATTKITTTLTHFMSRFWNHLNASGTASIPASAIESIAGGK